MSPPPAEFIESMTVLSSSIDAPFRRRMTVLTTKTLQHDEGLSLVSMCIFHLHSVAASSTYLDCSPTQNHIEVLRERHNKRTASELGSTEIQHLAQASYRVSIQKVSRLPKPRENRRMTWCYLPLKAKLTILRPKMCDMDATGGCTTVEASM